MFICGIEHAADNAYFEYISSPVPVLCSLAPVLFFAQLEHTLHHVIGEEQEHISEIKLLLGQK